MKPSMNLLFTHPGHHGHHGHRDHHGCHDHHGHHGHHEIGDDLLVDGLCDGVTLLLGALLDDGYIVS